VSLLTTLVDHLITIISKPLAAVDELDQSRDIVQVHAINILRAVVQESSLAVAVSRYYTTLTIASIDGFMSPFWTIRNASLQLLGMYHFPALSLLLVYRSFCVNVLL
jgi:hypothetical protein